MAVNTNPTAGTLDGLVKPSPYFQRAIHLRYDLDNAEAIALYVPTSNSALAIDAILRGTGHQANQRAHVLHAAYGSGKSLLAVALAGILGKREVCQPAVNTLARRITAIEPDSGDSVEQYLESKVRLLPVILIGDEGDLATALPRALKRSLDSANISLHTLGTRFDAALQAISRWRTSYPSTIVQLASLVEQASGTSLSSFCDALEQHDEHAVALFEQLYPRLTAGEVFDPSFGQTPDIVFREAALQLNLYGYSGIVVLWDEFGRYLESRTARAFSEEAAQLQAFAETCNYSGEHQIHLLLFAHKELQSYATALPKAYQQEWSRIEGRFQKHNVLSDPSVSFWLIASAIEFDSLTSVNRWLPEQDADAQARQALDAHLFGLLETHEIRRLIYHTWPLHPLTTYTLTHLSNRVAQNERTMFTFLTADEPHALQSLLRSMPLDDEDLFVRPAMLWDYFQDSIRSDTGPGGAHRVWSGVLHALDKIPASDALSETVIKTLGVISVCNDNGQARPTTELLLWAIGATTNASRAAVGQALENLRRRKAIIHRSIDGYWTFTSGSDIDFERQLAEVLERTSPSHLQLRRLMDRVTPAPYIVARRYNQEHIVTRFFKGLFRWPHEIAGTPWDAQIEQSQADGVCVYTLATTDFELQQAQEALEAHSQVLYVLPSAPLYALGDVLRELFALHELSNDPSLKSQDDRERIVRELRWLTEDAQSRLQREIDRLTDPRRGESRWVTPNGTGLTASAVNSPGETTRLVSEMCERVFPATPEINNEGLNKHEPTTQQAHAAMLVIDALFTRPVSPDMGLTGRGPEVLACNTLLRVPGILREEDGAWIVGRPDKNPKLAVIWDEIDEYISGCNIQDGQPIESLIAQLTKPPYGLREGLLPILLAAVLRSRIKATTIRRDSRPQYPINGELLFKMVYECDHFTLEVGEWSDLLERQWLALMEYFGQHIYDVEHNQEPLTMLKTAMVRWLQALPPYCRDTRHVSEGALQFRRLVRKAQLHPAQVVIEDFPALLALAPGTSQANIAHRLDSLLSEISNAYLELQRRLDLFAAHEFGGNSELQSGAVALAAWLQNVQRLYGADITRLRFGTPATQALVDTAMTQSEEATFWDQVSLSMTGLHLRDWNDQSEDKFCQAVLDARAEIEREFRGLLEEDDVVSVVASLPSGEQYEYRFRAAPVSQHGRRLLQNFISTLNVAGRPLSLDEKRQIAVDFLRHVMGDDIEN